MEFSFFFTSLPPTLLFSSWWSATSNAEKKWRACACGWGDWGSRVWSMGDWFYVCVRVHVCVLESWLSAWPPTFCSVSPLCSLSHSLHFREGFYLSSTETLSSLHIERRKGISAPHLLLCLLLYTAGRQADPVWEGCKLLLKHKAVHSYLLYLVVAYEKKSELVRIRFAANIIPDWVNFLPASLEKNDYVQCFCIYMNVSFKNQRIF